MASNYTPSECWKRIFDFPMHRVTSRRHFPSDALVGSVFGYLIGGYVVHHHAAETTGLGFSVLPVVDMSTRTFGANIGLRPDQLNLANLTRIVKGLHPNRLSFRDLF